MLDAVIAIGFFAFFFTMVTSIFLLRFTLDRKVRRLLPDDWPYMAITDSYFGLGRASAFGWCAAFKISQKSLFIKRSYNDIDVYKIASLFEKVIAYLMVFSLCAMLVIAFLIAPIFDWYGLTRFEIWEGLGVVPGYLR